MRPLLNVLVHDEQPVAPVSIRASMYHRLKTYVGLLPSPTNVFSTLRLPL
jgi:hypothetical protein